MLPFFFAPENLYWTCVIILAANLTLLVLGALLLKGHLLRKKKAKKASSLEASQLRYNLLIVIVLCSYMFLIVMFQGGYISSVHAKIAKLNISLEQGEKADARFNSVMVTEQVFGNEPGKFFQIDLKDIQMHRIFLFKGGQYTFDRSDTGFQAGMRELGKKISIYDNFCSYKIFIRGSADNADEKTFHGAYLSSLRFDTCHYFKDISPGKNGDKFSATPTPLRFPPVIHNTDLPALRSAYFAYKFRTSGERFKNIMLLEGKVEEVHNEKKRNVICLLYVDDTNSAMLQNAAFKNLWLFLLLLIFFVYVVIRQLKENRKILDWEHARKAFVLASKDVNSTRIVELAQYLKRNRR